MENYAKKLLKDRRGVSNTAVAFFASIVMLLIYWSIMNLPGGPEVLFYILYLFLRAIGVVGVDFGRFIEDVRNTPVWPLLILVGSQIGMVLVVAITFSSTWWTVGIAQRFLAWRRGRNEKQKKNVEEDEKERKLRRVKLKRKDERKYGLTGAHESLKTLSSDETRNKVKEPAKYEKLLETQWWQIRDMHVLTLTEGKLREIIKEAKKRFPTARSPEGSYRELAKASGMDHTTLFDIVKEGGNSMTVGNLMKLLDVLGASYEVLTPYIKSVGGKGDRESIVNPKFPININNPDGGRLLAASFKDGFINRKYHNFYYINYDPEKRRIVTEAVQRTFGNIEPLPTFDRQMDR